MTNVTNEDLMAYVDGELSGDDAARVRAALASDPTLREQASRMHALQAEIDSAYRTLDETPVPDGIMDLLENPEPDTSDNVVSLKAARQGKWWRPTAIAAALALVFVTSMWFGDDEFVAPGLDPALVVAAATVAGSDSHEGYEMQSSWQAADGRFCRQFATGSGEDRQQGLVCRQDSGEWKLAALVATGSETGFSPASGETGSPLAPWLKDLKRLDKSEEAALLEAR